MPIAYNYRDAAEQVGVSVSKIKTWVREGKIVARYAGKDVLIEHDELHGYVSTLPTDRTEQ